MAHFAPGSKAFGTTLSLTFSCGKGHDEPAKTLRQRELLAGMKFAMRQGAVRMDDRDDKHLMRAKAAGNPLQPKFPHWLPI
jgi:hypothetical protein